MGESEIAQAVLQIIRDDQGGVAVKKGIEVWPDYDRTGRWCLHIKKSRGRFTLDEIRETAREYEWDYYLLVIDAYHDDEDQMESGSVGDYATLYRTDLLREDEDG